MTDTVNAARPLCEAVTKVLTVPSEQVDNFAGIGFDVPMGCAGFLVTGSAGPLLVTVQDTWPVALPIRIRADGPPWLPVRVELGQVVIGPWDSPGVQGCPTCAEERRDRIRPDPAGHRAVLTAHSVALAATRSAWLTSLARDTVAELTAAEIIDFDVRPEMLRVNLRTLAVSRHAFLPDPRCPHCGGLPSDDEHAAVLRFDRPRPKRSPGVYRLKDAHRQRDQFINAYVDPEAGLVDELRSGDVGGLATVAARLGVASRRADIAGFGRSRSYRDSELIALFEALERYGGTAPGGKRTSVAAPYAEVADRALDPRSLGLYPAERYEVPDFPFRRFDPERPIAWVWGYSFQRRAPVLVPELIAYYGAASSLPGEVALVYECSNGCALGGCLEEAIIHAILEVAERDAFLLTWHARSIVPQLDLATASDPAIPLLAATITRQTGYRVAVFDTTVEHRIPCTWALAIHPEDDPGVAKLACTGGSALDPSRAALNALTELGPILAQLASRYPRNRERAARMTEDPSAVREMDDHSLLYASCEVKHRLDFLWAGETTRLPAPDPDFLHVDLRDDMEALVHRYLDAGLDVIIVDQTTPEHRSQDLHCVKAIIPGTLPMTFGHDYRRLDGLPRLSRRLSGSLNDQPHPFP